jgi:hypothetical protein
VQFETVHDGIAGAVGMGVAARYADAIGVANINTCVRRLAASCRAAIQAVRGITLVDSGPCPPDAELTGIIPFVCAGIAPTVVVKHLAALGTVVSVSSTASDTCVSTNASTSTSTSASTCTSTRASQHPHPHPHQKSQSGTTLQIALHYYNTNAEVALVCSQLAELCAGQLEDDEIDLTASLETEVADESDSEWIDVDCPLSPVRNTKHVLSAAGLSSSISNTLTTNAAFSAAAAQTSTALSEGPASDVQGVEVHGGNATGQHAAASASDSGVGGMRVEEDNVTEDVDPLGGMAVAPPAHTRASAAAPALAAAAAHSSSLPADHSHSLGGLGASIVLDDRLWDGPGAGAGGRGPASSARTVLFPLLAGISRRGMLGAAPLLFDGSPPACNVGWEGPLHMHRLFYQPSEPSLVEDDEADGYEAVVLTDDDEVGEDDDDDVVTLVEEMFLNGTCTVRVFWRQEFTLEDAIGSHTCSL